MASKYREQLLRAACAFRESGDEQAFLSEADRVIAAVSEEPMLPWAEATDWMPRTAGERLSYEQGAKDTRRKMSRARDKAVADGGGEV